MAPPRSRLAWRMDRTVDRCIGAVGLLMLVLATPAVADAVNDVAELQSIDRLLERGDAAAALGRVEALLASPELHPRNRWRARLRQGVALLGVERPAEAVPVFESVLAEVDDASAHLYLARALLAVGQRGRAIGEYQQALQLDDTDVGWHLEYATVLLELGAVRDAAARIDEARRLCGDCPPALRAAANLALARGDHAGAIEPLTVLMAHGAGPDVRRLLVAASWNSGHADAVAALLDTIPTHDLSGDEVMVLVQVERQLRRSERVVAWIEGPQEQLPDGWNPPAEFWAMSAEVCLQSGLPGLALAAIERALALKPGMALLHQNRAAALVALGRHDDARRALAEARRLERDAGEEP